MNAATAGEQMAHKAAQKMSRGIQKAEALGAQTVGVDQEEFRQEAVTMQFLQRAATGLVVIGALVAVGLTVNNSLSSGLNSTEAQSAITDANDGLSQLASFLGIIGTVVGAAYVINIISGSFGNAGGGQRGRA